MTDRSLWFTGVLVAWSLLLVPATVLAPFAIFLGGEDRGGVLLVLAMSLWLTVPLSFGGAIFGMLWFRRRGRLAAVIWCASAPLIHLTALASVMVLAEATGA